MSPPNHLSDFAGAHVYGTPALQLGTKDLCDRVRQDLTHLFTLVRGRCNFAPWTVQPDDFQL